MNFLSLSRRDWLHLLQTSVLPTVQRAAPAGGPALLIPAHPVLAASVTTVTPQNTPLLSSSQRGRRFPRAAHWEEEGLNSGLYSTLAFMLEGEADFRLGATRRMVQHDKRLSRKHGSYVVRLPTHSFFLAAAGVPFSDGSAPHWERPHIEEAMSRMLWFHIFPAGVSLKTCLTDGNFHDSSSAIFVAETRLISLAESVLEELNVRTPQSDFLARHYLSAFLLHLERALQTSRVPLEEEHLSPPVTEVLAVDNNAVRRACAYIERRLTQKITLAELAAHVYLSPAHLCRLFRSELDTTPGAYITRRRMEQARSLLETTDLPVQRIAVLAGYSNAQHFSHAFHRDTGMSPGAFRKRQ